MPAVDVLHGLKTGGRILINSAHKQDFAGYVTNHVDLTSIALRENLMVAGSPILNTPVIGALARTGIVSADSAKSAIRGMFSDERNIRAAEAAYDEVST
jgi:pyruvate ferredoxin oxidoreductase gamma subunit